MAGHGTYRAEIDGLRSLAVLPVVLYHFGMPGLSGGFVGVDVFFVISGFLIGGILWSELITTGRIRLGAFFLRRVKRLAPAYFAMALVTLGASAFILLPFDFREFGQSLLAATVYLSNVYFYLEAGYFDQDSALKPLLHTWSLSVEEQFYVCLPVLMLLLAGWRRVLPVVLVALAGVSLAASLWAIGWSQSAAFYLFPFRAWELLAGVLLAIAGQMRGWRWSGNPVLSWVGLILLVGSVTLLEEGAHFPGAWVIAPVLATVLLIANGRDDNLVNQLLTSRICLFFGLISYSLYLWHWPLVVLWSYVNDETPGLWTIPLLTALATGLAWVSYRYVETPFRRDRVALRPLLAGFFTVSAGTVAVGALVGFSNGLPQRFPAGAQTYITATQDFWQDVHCSTPVEGKWAGVQICPIGPEGPPQVVIWADSHGRAMSHGVRQAAEAAGLPTLLIWRGGCPPLLGVTKAEGVSSVSEDAGCTRQTATVWQALSQSPTIDRVLLIGRWSYYAEGSGVGQDRHYRLQLQADARTPDVTGGSQAEIFASSLRHTVARLHAGGDQVFVLRQVPEIFDFTARAAAQAAAYGAKTHDEIAAGLARTDLADVQARFRVADVTLEGLAREGLTTLIDPWPFFCDAEACSAVPEGQAIYFDNNHLTNAGALRLAPLLAPVFGGS